MENNVKLLLVDDNPMVLGMLEHALAPFARVVSATESADALLKAVDDPPDLVVCDYRMPGMDGRQLVEKLKSRPATANFSAILMASRSDIDERLSPQDAADDYLAKPFDLSILLARLQGLLRRSQWVRGEQTPLAGEARGAAGDAEDFGTFSFDGKTIDFGALELRSGGNTIHLTLMESELLRHLVRNDGRVVSRKQILEEVWGLHEDTDTRAIDNFVVRLRRYIEDDPATPRHLLTVRGVGYRFLARPEKE